jgi:hypothetical protein
MGTINVTPVFVLAGDATFTVANGEGKHYTFHVWKSEPNQQFPNPAHFIEVLTGPDNTTDYTYIGKVRIYPNNNPVIHLTGKSKYKPGDTIVKVADWALRVIWQAQYRGYKVPMAYSIRHSGNCGKCGRPLTTPASLDTGLGPDCAAELGVEWGERMEESMPQHAFPYSGHNDANNTAHPGHPNNHGDK